MGKRLQDSIGVFLVSLLLIGCFAPVVMRRASLLTSPIIPGVLSTGPYGYDGHKPMSSHVIDPGASSWAGEPWIKLAGSQIQQGQVPLWNPYNGFGAPLAANMQSGVFFPLHGLLFFSSDPWTWNVFLLLRLFVAGAFTYLYLRLLRVSMLSAMVAAIAFMLSGRFILYVNMMHLNVEVLLPLVVYLTERLIRYRTFGSMLLLGGALTLTILGGMPESTLFLWSFATLYYMVRVAAIGMRRGRVLATILRLLPLLVTPLFVALGLSTVQLLPFVEYLWHSWTGHSGPIGLTGNAPSTAISLIVPYFFNHLGQSWGPVISHDVLPYIGIMPVLLASLAFPARGRLRAIAFFCAVYAVVGLLKAHAVPGVNLIGSIPLYDLAIFPKYNQPEVGFAVAVLAGLGAHNILQPNMKVPIVRIGLVCAILAIVMVAFLDVWWSTIAAAQAIWWVAKQMAQATLVMATGAMLLCCFRTLRRTRRSLLVSAMLIVLSVEMYLYTPKDRPSKYEAASTPPFVEFLRAQCPPGECRVYGLDSVLFPNWNAVFQLTDIRMLDAMYVDRLLKFSNVLLGNNEHDRFTGGTSREFKPNLFLGFSNVRYLLTSEEIAATDFIDAVLRDGERRAEASFISKGRFVIGGVAKPVLFEHPPAEITYPLVVPMSGARLQFSLGMDPAVWSPSKGDGMEFEIEVVSEEARASLFKRYYDPKNEEMDRRWVDGEVDLSPFRGQQIHLRLITRPGKGNAFDHGGWGHPHLVTPDTNEGQTKWPTLVYNGEIKIYENRGVIPRAFVVYHAEAMQRAGAILERLRSPGFDPRRVVILEGKVPIGRLQGLGPGVPEGPAARISKYLPDRVEMSVETTHPGVLVLLDAYYPGWRATINGKPARIYRANYLFRGVFVEAGEHEVRFDYSPQSFWAGLLVGAGTLIVLGATVALLRARQRRRESIT